MYGFFATQQYCGFNKKNITAHIAHYKYFIYLIMHILGILFLIFLTPFITKGQSSFNYITNPSFEDIDSCYGNFAPLNFDVFEWSNCTGWSNPISSSSDLWCPNGVVGSVSPPLIAGLGFFQNPKHGENFAGIMINDGIVFNYREYIQNKLIQPLTAGKYYEISFYISSTVAECSAVEFGVKFFNQKYHDTSKFWLTEMIPDAVNDYTTFIVDTLGWQKVTMHYKANGTERYMILGNFEDSTKIKNSWPCDTTYWEGLKLAGGYYFIDDVSLTEVTPDVFIPNVFSPNADGVNDFFEIKATNIQGWNCSIYNRWGMLITTLNESNNKWDGKGYADGTYYYVFSSEYLNKTGFFSLFK